MLYRMLFRIFPWVALIVILAAAYFWRQSILQPDPAVTSITSTVILEKMQTIGKVELVKYNFSEVIEISKKSPEFLSIFKLGPDSKAILIATGEATGCIDLTRVTINDLAWQPDTLLVRLPEPELCYYKLDLEETSLYHLQTGYFEKQSHFIESAYQHAEKQIKDAAFESDILKQTKSNAEIILKPLLEEISGKKIILSYPVSGGDDFENLLD